MTGPSSIQSTRSGDSIAAAAPQPEPATSTQAGEVPEPDEAEPAKQRLSKERLKGAAEFLNYLKPYRGKLMMALLALWAATGLVLVFPWLIGALVDGAGRAPAERSDIVLGGDMNKIALAIVVLLGVQAVISFFRIVWFAEFGERAIAAIRSDVYAHLVCLPMTFFNRRRVGELTSRLAADLTQIQETLIREVPAMLRQGTVALGGLVIVTIFYGKLALVMISTFPITVALAIFIGTFVRKLSRKAQDELAEANTVVEETLQGVQTVKAFANEPLEAARYRTVMERFVDVAVRGARYRAALVSFIIFGLFGAITLVIWYGTTLVERGEISGGDLTRFVLYTIFIGTALQTLSEFYANLQKTVGATERIRELLDEAPEPGVSGAADHPLVSSATPGPEAPGEGAVGGETVRGQVEFRDVRFAYPTRPELEVLRGISLRAKPGETVALVGASGFTMFPPANCS
jgi:ATP-binding cassette subfamily B protein